MVLSFFFFSSRRRHTRSYGDWSSDVCSSDLGHNGLRSIDAMIGADYWRVRLGIGHPGIKELVHPYVLQNFTADEELLIVAPLLDAVAETIPLLLEGAPEAFM